MVDFGSNRPGHDLSMVDFGSNRPGPRPIDGRFWIESTGSATYRWSTLDRIDRVRDLSMVDFSEHRPGHDLSRGDPSIDLRYEVKEECLMYVSHPLERGIPPPWANGWGDSRSGPMVSFRVESVEYWLRWIPIGTFKMGSPETEPGRRDDEVEHLVKISQGFWMGETQVTQALWTAVMGKGRHQFGFKDSRRPVENVSWEDTQAFIRTLETKKPGVRMRLPTEAQWEYACRAGSQEATYAGPIDIAGDHNAPVLDSIAWYGGNCGHEFDLERGEDSSKWPGKQYNHSKAGTRRVRSRRKNSWGLYDMLGNVWEWCQDWYGPYAPAHDPSYALVDPMGPNEGSFRVVRGGSWASQASNLRAASRYHYDSSYKDTNIGFRLCRRLVI